MEEILASIRRIIEDSDTVKKPALFERHTPVSDAEDDVDEPALEPANSDVVSFLRSADVEAPAPEMDIPQPQAFAEEVAPPVDASSAAMDVADAQFELPEDFADQFVELQSALDDDMQEAQEPAFEDSAPFEEPIVANIAKAPLVSDMTGRQVAAAFGELSDVFAASRRKSFDEMAEEMLRPMLQEWLDDNLPTLVERLVREEIERVARGGAR